MLQVGDRVRLGKSSLGTARYVGPVSYANGLFVGVELDAPTGKNDGTVKGKQYFQCAPKHGAFARLDQVKPGGPPAASLAAPPPRPPPTAASGCAGPWFEGLVTELQERGFAVPSHRISGPNRV